jgi:hypothetical protein
MKIIEKSGYQALPWVRYITQSGGKTAGLPGTMGSRRWGGGDSGLESHSASDNSETQQA